MKKRFFFVFIFILLLPAMVSATTITVTGIGVRLTWDANEPAPDGYRVFVRVEGQEFDYQKPAWSGAGTMAEIFLPAVEEDTTYYFVVRAFEGDLESADSEEVTLIGTSELNKEYSITVPGIKRIKGEN